MVVVVLSFIFFYNSENHNFVNQTESVSLTQDERVCEREREGGEEIQHPAMSSPQVAGRGLTVLNHTEAQMRCCWATYSWENMNKGPLTPERGGTAGQKNGSTQV